MNTSSLCRFFLVASATLSLSPVMAQGPTQTLPSSDPPVASVVSHGYKIVITNPSWNNYMFASVNLAFDFTVQKPDGTPVDFASANRAIVVKGWTESQFDGTVSHSAIANYDQNSEVWHARIPHVDPRAKAIHLEFVIRNPGTSAAQTTDLTSDFRFDYVNLPSKTDTVEPVNKSFATVWGTVFTLVGVSVVTNGQFGKATQYDFTVDHKSTPDDNAQLQFVNAYDSGVQVDGLYPMNGFSQNPGPSMSVTSSPIDLTAHKAVSLEFSARESAFSRVASIVWTPVEMDLPISSAWKFNTQYVVADQGTSTVNNLKLKIEHVQDSGSGARYVVFCQSPNPSQPLRFIKAAWATVSTTPPATGQAMPFGQQQNNVELFSDTYWHIDHTVVGPAESGAFIRSDDGKANFPLLVTGQQVNRDEQQISFSAVPVPSPGQSLVIDQTPDKAAKVPMRLRSISLAGPVAGGPMQGFRNSPYSLRLTFEYNVTDGSAVTLTALSARDVDGNALDTADNQGGPNNVDVQDATIQLNVAAPPAGSKTIDLRMMLTKETPIGAQLIFSVGSDDQWNLTN